MKSKSLKCLYSNALRVRALVAVDMPSTQVARELNLDLQQVERFLDPCWFNSIEAKVKLHSQIQIASRTLHGARWRRAIELAKQFPYSAGNIEKILREPSVLTRQHPRHDLVWQVLAERAAGASLMELQEWHALSQADVINLCKYWYLPPDGRPIDRYPRGRRPLSPTPRVV